jgi:hypothetical protein
MRDRVEISKQSRLSWSFYIYIYEKLKVGLHAWLCLSME